MKKTHMSNEEAITVLSALHVGYGDKAKEACEIAIKALMKETGNTVIVRGEQYEIR